MGFLDNIKKRKELNKKGAEFKFTHNVENLIKFNDKTKEILIPSIIGNEFLNYSDVKDFELIEKTDTATIKKGGLGRAVAGEVLFGATGAIVGGITGKQQSNQMCTLMKINIITGNLDKPIVPIYLLTKKEKMDSINYKAHLSLANKILAILEIIAKQNNNELNNINTNKNSVADELMKLKNLLDLGILTQEEFDNEKFKILNK